jgi:putative PIN family toxin of toxin-antitoxin system
VRVVLDTDVIVAAIRSSQGASRWLLRTALEREIALIISVPLFLEYEAVLTRPEHLQAMGATEETLCEILDAIAAVSVHTRLSFRWRPLLSDANDDMVLETAINGRAELLVTFNIRDFASTGEPFGCRTVLPRDAVGLIRDRLQR